MTNKAFAAWCKAATEKIRYGPDREAVSAELQAHLEDKYDAFLAQGLTHEEATARTLEDMGSAGEIAPQLGAIHRPWLGWIFSAVRLISIWIAVAVGYMALITVGHQFSWWADTTYESEDYLAHAEPGCYLQANDLAYGEGYILWVPEAAVNTAEERLYFRLEAHSMPWMGGTCPVDCFWAVDSQGTVYLSDSRLRDSTQPQLCFLRSIRSSSGPDMYDLILTGFDCNAQWVELHYDRDGRDIVLRIDLTGGEPV